MLYVFQKIVYKQKINSLSLVFKKTIFFNQMLLWSYKLIKFFTQQFKKNYYYKIIKPISKNFIQNSKQVIFWRIY